MSLVVEMFEILLLISIHINVWLWLVDVHAGRSTIVREVLVEGQPGPLGWSACGGGGPWGCGGSGGGGCAGGGRGHPESGRCCVLRPVVHLRWSAIVGKVDVNLKEYIS